MDQSIDHVSISAVVFTAPTQPSKNSSQVVTVRVSEFPKLWMISLNSFLFFVWFFLRGKMLQKGGYVSLVIIKEIQGFIMP